MEGVRKASCTKILVHFQGALINAISTLSKLYHRRGHRQRSGKTIQAVLFRPLSPPCVINLSLSNDKPKLLS